MVKTEINEYNFRIDNDNLRFYHHRASGKVAVQLSGLVFHTHDFPEIVYVVEAKGQHITENMEYELRKNMLIINPPGVHHKIKLDPNAIYDRYYICFNPDILDGQDVERIYKNMVMDCTENKMFENIFKRSDYYSKYLEGDALSDMLGLLTKELYYNLAIYEDVKSVEYTAVHPLLTKAMDYIGKNLFEIKNIAEISDSLFITERYLYELFKFQLKTTPKKYINEKRLHFAKQKILQGEKPSEVYFKVGFSDYSTFYRSYLKYFGYAPSGEKKGKNFAKDIYAP